MKEKDFKEAQDIKNRIQRLQNIINDAEVNISKIKNYSKDGNYLFSISVKSSDSLFNIDNIFIKESHLPTAVADALCDYYKFVIRQSEDGIKTLNELFNKI